MDFELCICELFLLFVYFIYWNRSLFIGFIRFIYCWRYLDGVRDIVFFVVLFCGFFVCDIFWIYENLIIFEDKGLCFCVFECVCDFFMFYVFVNYN